MSDRVVSGEPAAPPVYARWHTGSCAYTQSQLRPLEPLAPCNCGADEYNAGLVSDNHRNGAPEEPLDAAK